MARTLLGILTQERRMSLASIGRFFDTSNLNFSGDGGVLNNTVPYVDSPPDASGGTGSFLDALVPTLTNGLNAAINAELLNSLGKNGNLYTVDANGDLVPKSAAGANNARYEDMIAPSPNNRNLYIYGGLAVLAVVILIVAID